MTIEIHEPALEALIQEQMASGAFRDVDELLTRALDSLRLSPADELQEATGGRLIEAGARLRGLFTNEEVDSLFSRTPSISRPVSFE
jgi:Arc/MetJ-type ribon-helix-helix transcriptional regulator